MHKLTNIWTKNYACLLIYDFDHIDLVWMMNDTFGFEQAILFRKAYIGNYDLDVLRAIVLIWDLADQLQIYF